MFLKERKSGHLLAVKNVDELFNPYNKLLEGCLQFGEEEQDPEQFTKSALVFPSDEELPQCWLNPKYRDASAMRHYNEDSVSH